MNSSSSKESELATMSSNAELYWLGRTEHRSANIDKAVRDIRDGMEKWRIWWLLGIGDVRQRYARSRLGQFWITVSMAFFVGVIGSVYTLLFNQPMREFLPYLASNFVVWTMISGIVVDSCWVFTHSENFLRQEPLPKTVFVMRMLVRNLINFGHNILIVPAVLIVMGHWPSPTFLLAPFGLLLILVAGFFVALILGLLCARFRDLPQIVLNFVQVAFFVTPVVWPASILRGRASHLIEFNPFAAFLNVVAEPLRGNVPELGSYVLSCASILLLAAVAIPLFVRFRARIVYWL